MARILYASGKEECLGAGDHGASRGSFPDRRARRPDDGHGPASARIGGNGRSATTGGGMLNEAKVARAIMTRRSGRERPIRRRLATLFVDIAGSTSLLVHHAPEVVLGVVQGFMTLVTELASAHAGTGKDFEGDGALLYFAS